MPVVTAIGRHVEIACQNCMMPRTPEETQVETKYWY